MINKPGDSGKYDYTFYPITFESNVDFQLYVSLPLFTDDECDSILSKWDEERMEQSRHTSGSGKTTRQSDIQWVDWYEETWDWVFKKISAIIEKTNEEVFKYELSKPCTFNSIQYTKYNAGDYYHTHRDWYGETNHDIRKLSFTINLSKEDDYTGGGLEIDTSATKFTEVRNDRGWIHIFPSFLLHRALEVKTGERFALISWVAGPPFK